MPIQSFLTLDDCVQWRAESHPEKRALTFLSGGEEETATWTYRELIRKSRAIAAYLQKRQPEGERALLLYPTCLDFAAGFLGCLQAGMIAVPVSPPRGMKQDSRLGAIARDAQAAFVLSTSESMEKMKGKMAQLAPELASAELVLTDKLDEALADRFVPLKPESNRIAFLQYTSGSTATPKGVMVSHANLMANEEMMRQAFAATEADTTITWAPLYHDMSLIGNLLLSLVTGGHCVLMPPTTFLVKPLRWLAAIDRYRGTMAGGPNFAYEHCLRRIAPEERATLDLSCWRIAANGSEPIRYETVRSFSEGFAACGFRAQTFYPCYGLAEATLFVTGDRLDRAPLMTTFSGDALARHRAVEEEPGAAGAVSLVSSGRKAWGETVRIVEAETGRVLADGEVGEIWVKGPHIAVGYWERPEASQETFMAYTKAPEVDGPFMRTGDLGFLWQEELYVTGRLKDLIIYRGRNVYPQDLEQSAENSHEGLSHGACAAFTLGEDERLIVAIEVDRRHLKSDLRGIASAVRKKTAVDHEVTVDEVLLLHPASIPKTTSGKIQRSRCRQAYLNGELNLIYRLEAEREPEAETLDRERLLALAPDELEQALVTYLRRQIGLATGSPEGEIDPSVAVNSFGVDSLRLVELRNRLVQGLGVSLSLREFFDDIDLFALAARLRREMEQASQRSELKVRAPLRAGGTIPLSAGQRAMWVLQKLSPESVAYQLVRAVWIHEELDLLAFSQAFAVVAARHESFRCSFQLRDGEPQQRLEETQPALEVFDAESWSEQDLNQALLRDAETPFDLECAPLVRVRLYRRGAKRFALSLAAHHIVMDFWSLSLVLDEWIRLYRSGTIATLPATPSHDFGDYVQWQREMLEGELGASHWQYWSAKLAGKLPVLNLPFDRPRGARQTFHGAVLTTSLDPQTTQALHQLAKSEQASLYMVLLAGFKAMLYRYTGTTDLLVGSPSSGRARAEFEGLVGYFVNPLVIRTQLEGVDSFRDLLKRVRQSVLEAFQYPDFPFMTLAERLQPERDLSHAPLFTLMFSYQKTPRLAEEGLAALALGEPGVPMNLGGMAWETLPLPSQAAQLDLTLMMTERDGAIRASFEYNTDLFERESVARMAANLMELLRGIVAHPERQLERLPLLSAAEYERVTRIWNATEVDYNQRLTIHRAFSEQVARTPEAIALVFEDQRLSFAELDRRANQLAHHLREWRVAPETPVGLCLHRSPEMVIGLLAILKAGGAYVPLDPDYPVARLRMIVEDSGMPVLVTSSAQVQLFQGLKPNLVELDRERGWIERRPVTAPLDGCGAEQLAYVLYTSGSTGRPKGVPVTHRNAINFFKGMDERIPRGEGDAMLAVTSISFDISILELFWTLTGGTRVVLLSEEAVSQTEPNKASGPRPIAFSLFYFASDEARRDRNKYRLLMEGAKFADRHGFQAIWTPERHFHEFGGKYPNPSLTSAFLAGITSRVALRGGSVVLPLHDPVRVAEEWSAVDNLSKGRVGIAFASGWNANDFVLKPERYAKRRELMYEEMQLIDRLWSGASLTRRNGADKDYEFRIFPKPVQERLPVWVTSGGDVETIRKAGETGSNLLTHLLGQTLAEVEEKIALYREARRAAGYDPDMGIVTLMLHCFLGESREMVRQTVRTPFRNYLRSSIGLIRNLAKSLDLPFDPDKISPDQMEELLDVAFERYFETSALFGTVESCQVMVDGLRRIGVDEVACLIDFGVDEERVLESLEQLARLESQNRVRPPSRHPLPLQAEAEAVTMMQCTPSTLSLLWQHPRSRQSLKVLKTLLLGGEALPPALAEAAEQELGVDLHNMYGPTETTIWSTCAQRPQRNGRVTIGTPIANTQIYLLSPAAEPVPIGVGGELCIAGDGVARGYLGRPELTAERFLPNPFSGRPGDRLYLTGDLARYAADGTIEHLGRLDHQVKVRGFRIELEEIEAVLAAHPHVGEAVALVRTDLGQDPLILAFYVPREHGSEHADLRAHMGRHLPAYMVPGRFVVLERFPLTPNGKIDRKALGAMPLEREVEKLDVAGYLAPRTPIEEILTGVWSQVLSMPKVGIRINFFASGGHSLSATQVMARIRDLFGIDLPLRTIFENPTIEALAQRVEQAREGHPAARLAPLVSVSREEHLVLSFAQQRLWVLHQLEPENIAYNHSYLVRIEGPLERELFAESFAGLMARHEALRSRFALDDATPVQVIDSQEAVLEWTDLSNAGENAEAQLAETVLREGRERYDLMKGPLIRARLFGLAPDRHVLFLGVHFVVADGWSLEIMLHEVLALYQHLVTGQPLALPELRVQYADFSAWQRKSLTREALAGQLEYWKERLAKPPVLELPTDFPRPKRQTSNGALHRIAFSQALTERLREFCRREEITPFMVFAAAYALVLARYSQQSDLVIGFPVANRTRPELEHLVGCFVNTLPLRVDLTGAPSFRELLRRVRATTLEAFAHQDVPFELLIQELELDRDLSRTPLFQTMLILQKAPEAVAEDAALRLSREMVDQGTAKYDLALDLTEEPDQIHGHFEFNTDLFQAGTIARLADHLQSALRHAFESPDQDVFALELLNADESRLILCDWNCTAAGYATEAPYPRLFENKVRHYPNKIAVVDEQGSITYAELNRRANRLARLLIERGAGLERPVGVHMERSIEMVVALLATMKSGSYYVPMDPGYPPDRLAYMVRDSRMALLLDRGEEREWMKALEVERLDLGSPRVQAELERLDHTDLRIQPDSFNLAYVIYTSGSTGNPKGVQIHHRALINFISSIRREPGISSGDVILSVTTPSFDIMGLELYVPLFVGAKVVLMSQRLTNDGGALIKWLEEHRATVMQATPSTWRLMREEGWRGKRGLDIYCGGDLLPRDLAQELTTCGTSVWNLYGPTETTIWSTRHLLKPGESRVSIGKPIANTQTYILDKRFRPTPIGVPGELFIGGDGVARGYLNRPDLTAERFVPDPFSSEPGARLYRTGDLVRAAADGTMEMLGRIDYQVKLRGFRIELGEIEHRLVEHEDVAQAVVLVQKDGEEQSLSAYLIPRDGKAPEIPALLTWLRDRLPAYMVPSGFLVMSVFPLTPNGKIDRKALPPIRRDREASGERYLAPRTALESVLVRLWTNALKLERVGVRDSFFDLGGNSLLATQIAIRVRETFQVNLPLHHFFEKPTVEGLAEVLLAGEPKQGQLEKKAQIIERIKNMSPEELEALKRKKRPAD